MMRFCDLEMEDSVPDHSVLSRFRTELTEKKAFDRILKKINRQLVAHKVIILNGVGIVDATLTDTPRCPDGKPMYEIAEDTCKKPYSTQSIQKQTIN
jgi:IS5 family transposase